METAMTRLEQIEKIVRDLPPEEFDAFARWFEELSADRWDRRIESDSASGKLDALADAALAAFRKGDSRPL
jgi:hypothetical protein